MDYQMKKWIASAFALSAFAFVGCSTPKSASVSVEKPMAPIAMASDTPERAPSSSSDSRAELEKCIKRVETAGCALSNNNEDRIAANVFKCRHVESNSGKTKLEIFLLDRADKVVVVKTGGSGVSKPFCPTTKFTVDRAGIKDLKVIENRVFLVSNDGQVYFMHSDETFYELLNSRGYSYTGVANIKGANGGQSIVLEFRDGNRLVLDDQDIRNKIEDGRFRQLEFYRYTTNRSLFRDE
jgi:hypothetical protein